MIEKRKFSILVVDDDESNLDLLAGIMRRDHNVFEAMTGEQALKIVEDNDIQLVISDHWLPGMSGIELLAKLRRLHPEIIRMLITGLADWRVAVEAINKGQVHRFLSKPWDTTELREIVSAELRNYLALSERTDLMQDLKKKNRELMNAYDEIMVQKKRLEELAREYKEQKETSMELSDKFAKANIDLMHAQQEIRQKNMKLEAVNKKLELLSITDDLTGFYNHRQMKVLIEQEIGRAKRYDLELACLMVDLDYFKNANDQFGHPFGDTVLRTVSSIIQKNIRDTDLPCRYGGDEFLIILPHTDIDMAHSLANRIHEDIKTHVFVTSTDSKYKQTVSIGIANFSGDTISPDQNIVNLVDRALYQAKETGRNKVVIIDKIEE